MAVSNDKLKAYVTAAEARITALFALVGAHSLPGSQEKAQRVASATRKHAATVADYDKAREELGLDLDSDAPPAEVPTGTAALSTSPAPSTTTSSPAASPPSTLTPAVSKAADASTGSAATKS